MLGLKLCSAAKPRAVDVRRKTPRQILLDALDHQIKLVKNPAHVVERVRYVKTDGEGYARRKIARSPRPWWWLGEDGQTRYLQIKFGSTAVVELAEGLPTVECKSDKELLAALTTVAEAVKAGKLDAQIEAARERTRKRRDPQ